MLSSALAFTSLKEKKATQEQKRQERLAKWVLFDMYIYCLLVVYGINTPRERVSS